MREKEELTLNFIIQVDTLCHRIPNFVEKAARAGCARVFIGLENINPDNLLSAKKKQNRVHEYRELFLAWRRHKVITYAGYIIGFPADTPERLVRVDGRQVDTRPIAGTRPRSRRPEAESAEMSELAAHPKERAEHIMLIDLERNDLGRVCAGGSVRVDEYMSVETYAHVHHIVSNVSGRLRNDVSPIGVIRALFPGGTITGCPKVRCMEIIAELEGTGRGAYTGTIGYLNRDGSCDLNILIRTITAHRGTLGFRAGAGIVADSSPEHELAETRAKAEGMLRALRAPA